MPSPSQTHADWLMLFENRPELAAELLREALHVELPHYNEARIHTAELKEPTELRADLVVVLHDVKPVLGIVVEIQLSHSARKRFTWPAYAINLRARLRCPVGVLVVTPRKALVRWASRPIELGCGNWFTPMVLGPSGVPTVTDPARAAEDPELALLSVMAHGKDADPVLAAQMAVVARAATSKLEPDTAMLYLDVIGLSLSGAARKLLATMDPETYVFRSPFAVRCIAKGEKRGARKMLSLLLKQRFGALDEATRKRVRAAKMDEIEGWATRVLTAATLEEVFG